MRDVLSVAAGRAGATVGRAAVDEDFDAIWRAHHDRALRLAYLLTGDATAAEDAVAASFARVWVRWRDGAVRDVGGYVRSAIVNEVRDRGRRHTTFVRFADRRRGDDRGDRDLATATADRAEMLAALSRLTPRQREVVVLRYYEGLAEATIADVLGCAVGTVKSTLSRSLSRLRESLQETERRVPTTASSNGRSGSDCATSPWTSARRSSCSRRAGPGRARRPPGTGPGGYWCRPRPPSWSSPPLLRRWWSAAKSRRHTCGLQNHRQHR